MTAQGIYLIIAPDGTLYASSVAGKRRSFTARRREHERLLELGTHPNDKFQAAWHRTQGRGWCWLVVAREGS
jgi:hypothetical protein